MIERDIALILIGAGIALISSIITAILQHLLSLRADKIKRARTLKEQFAQAGKEALVKGASLDQLEPAYWAKLEHLSVGVEKPVLAKSPPMEEEDELSDAPAEPPRVILNSSP